jgi:hypothetical protein
LNASGLPPVPDSFSVVPGHQCIPRRIIDDAVKFIRVFDAVTTRPQWQRAVAADAAPIGRPAQGQTCFFSAWDVHLPPDNPADWRLIEFNDNGSGFLFAALINRLYYETGELAGDDSIEPPPSAADFRSNLIDSIEHEARAFFGGIPDGLFLVLDDEDSIREGRFSREHDMLRGVLEARGLRTALGTPARLAARSGRLHFSGEEVAFVINRSTDFFWEADEFAALRDGWRAGKVYAAPNPFTYATRSDKGVLAALCDSGKDRELGIRPDERAVLDARVARTLPVTEDTIEELARRKHELVFKPRHGHAGRGLLPSEQIGRSRLERLIRKGHRYVAQQRVPRTAIEAPDAPGTQLWTDLRVWAYRGRRFLISGRASTEADGLTVEPPGGWLPTFTFG